ncbi:MAG: hypothetical protein IKB27_02950 [Clostridia bacterium]|nr:hypothetical protein [Clostridia bacterium]
MEKKYLIDNPKLMTEWNYEKNTDLDPSKLTLGSNKKVWWKCENGHEWLAIIWNRYKGADCPFCAGKIAIKGENDLQTVNPSLAKEWNYERNKGLTPMDVLPNSNKKVWWKCSKDHEWESSINHRNNGRNCPYCAGKKVIKGYTDLQTTNPVLASEWNYEKNNGLTPAEVSSGSDKKVWWKCKKGHEWQATISSRTQGANCPYCANQKAIKGFNDLQTINPNLAKEWNYEKNDELTPLDIMPNSNKKVWWKCKKGHEWQATVSHRSNGRGCPICSSERRTSFPEYALAFYLKKFGIDVRHSYKDFGYELDIYIPSMKTAIEYDGYFWHKNKAEKDLEKNEKCKKDGIKLYRIREKLPPLNDSSLDYIVDDYYKDLQKIIKMILDEITNCSLDIDLKRDVIEIESLREYTEKENSLLVMNPKIAQEWNYAKNGKLRPEIVSASSHKKARWICSKGHEWQAAISSRNKGAGCPYCSGYFAIKGENDLQTLNPTLASEWDYVKNNGLLPTDVTPNSNKKVWWICKNGHKWQAVISSRNRGNGCPYCSGQRLIKGKNDLQTINPILASEWNYEKNAELTPAHVFPNSNKKVWWKCKKGHEWEAIIQSRNNGRGCPYCSGRKKPDSD